jgi:hypothetical protein
MQSQFPAMHIALLPMNEMYGREHSLLSAQLHLIRFFLVQGVKIQRAELETGVVQQKHP